jgi:hypothetical protein
MHFYIVLGRTNGVHCRSFPGLDMKTGGIPAPTILSLDRVLPSTRGGVHMGKRRTEISRPNVLELADVEDEFFLGVEPLQTEDDLDTDLASVSGDLPAPAF